MARPPSDAPIDLSQVHDLTAGLIERLTCRTDTKAQAFLRDAKVPGLRVRVSNTGAKSFVFEAKLNRQTIRRTIGDVSTWSIDQARIEARRLAVMLDTGTDPREVERQQQADKAAQTVVAAAHAVTLGEAWKAYVIARKPYWGDWQYQDQLTLGDAGGLQPKRGKPDTLTKARPIHPLMSRRLADVS
jgi:hypothetical protein